jgi:hypothetical protein
LRGAVSGRDHPLGARGRGLPCRPRGRPHQQRHHHGGRELGEHDVGDRGGSSEIDRAVGVIWSRCPVEIDALVATARIDGTSSATATTRTFDRDELTALLGEQPDVQSSLGPSRATLLRWSAGGFVISLVTTALLLWLFRRRADRRRRSGGAGDPSAPAWRGVPGYAPPAPPGWSGPQPNPGAPPGWSGPRPGPGTPPPGWFTPQREPAAAPGSAAYRGPGAPAVPPPPPPPPEPPAPEPAYDIWARWPS